MKTQYEMMTKIGLKRTVNQDRITAHGNDRITVFVVADGMGGHSDGEKASQKVIDSFDKLWKKLSLYSGNINGAVDMVISVLEQINDEIYKYAEENKIICGTTASILLISDETFASINVGDSPIYCADRRKAIHLSTEHSYDVMSVKSGKTTGLDASRKGRLVQAIGVKHKIYPSVVTGKIKENTLFFLCSDGISKYFSEDEIKKKLKSAVRKKINLEKLCIYFKDKVYELGASDNLSEIAVHCETQSMSTKRKLWTLALISAAVFVLWIIINMFIMRQ